MLNPIQIKPSTANKEAFIDLSKAGHQGKKTKKQWEKLGVYPKVIFHDKKSIKLARLSI